MLRNTICATIVISLLMAARGYGDSVPLVNIDPSTQIGTPGGYFGFNETHGDGVVGWGFYLVQPVTVTQVGFYDDGQDGLSRGFRIGLWAGQITPSVPTHPQLLGTPNGGVTIPGGTNAVLESIWRVVDLPTPLDLQPGFYTLGALDTATTTDPIKYLAFPPSYTGAPDSLTGYRAGIGNFFYAGMAGGGPGFNPPTAFYLAYGMELGPMLFVSVPEPAGFILMALALTGVLLFAKRTSKRALIF